MTRCKEKCLAIFGYGTIAIATALVAILVYWMVYPYKLIDFYTKPYVVTDRTVYQGEYLEYSFKYCKHTTLMPDSITREFVNGIIFQSADARANVQTGCSEASARTFVPPELPPGTYIMRITITYKPNPIRTITYINETEKFNVLERN